jgi:hypothetical protein
MTDERIGVTGDGIILNVCSAPPPFGTSLPVLWLDAETVCQPHGDESGRKTHLGSSNKKKGGNRY